MAGNDENSEADSFIMKLIVMLIGAIKKRC